MSSLSFTNLRRPNDVAQLDAVLAAQVVVAGRLLDGEELPASARIVHEDLQDEPAFYLPEVWDLVDDTTGEVRYQAWFYGVDTGAIFHAGTTEVVGEILQGGLDSRNPLAPALRDAKRRVGAVAEGTTMAGVSFD